MDQGTEPIRQDIDQIRASMTDKMEKIEAKIKGTVDETTGSVKRMVDVKHQISEHPWTALGVSVLAGIALGSLGDSDTSPERSDYRSDMSAEAAYERARSTSPYSSNYSQASYGNSSYGQANHNAAGYTMPGSTPGSDQSYSQEYRQFGGALPQSYGTPNYNQASYSSNAFAPTGGAWSANPASGATGNGWSNGHNQPSKPGVMDQLSRQFGGEIEMLKSAAVSSLVGIIRDTIRQNFPSMHQEMERMRRDPRTGSGTATRSSGSNTPSSSSFGNTDYAHNAVNNPSHVPGVSDPASGVNSYDARNSNPDDLQRGNSTL